MEVVGESRQEIRAKLKRKSAPAQLSAGALFIKFPAAIYSPTQLPVQYHRP